MERRDTPLYRLKTRVQQVGEVLSALAEGLDVAAGVRVFGHAEATIQRWLTRAAGLFSWKSSVFGPFCTVRALFAQ